jgi:gliding motility-associated-like protein
MKREIYPLPVTLLFLLFSILNAVAQRENNHWYFGHNAGLDFSGGAPVADINGQIFTPEGSAVLSDTAGNLLFYTDGRVVWNRNHIAMPNGYGLFGGISSTQSALIVNKPGSDHICYIFTSADQGGPAGICYSEVDMLLNGGLGDVTVKNISLNAPSAEKLAGTMHCNGVDIWVLSHDFNSNAFRAWLVTSAGVTNPPIVSAVGTFVGMSSNAAIGQMKFSKDGKRLATVRHTPNNTPELFDFDRSTGIVSHPLLLNVPASASSSYGIEFSPNGTKLYVTIFSPGVIYQFNLCAGSDSAIINSGMVVGNTTAVYFGSLQIGPDDRIYAARMNSGWLAVIEHPEVGGAGCGYINDGVFLDGKLNGLGLPSFITGGKKMPSPPMSYTQNCMSASFFSHTTSSTAGCSGTAVSLVPCQWDFGDAGSVSNTSSSPNPVHAFSDTGTYLVQLFLFYPCTTDTLSSVLHVTNLEVGISYTNASCYLNDGTATAYITDSTYSGTLSFSWSDGQTGSTATGLGEGNIVVTVSDNYGCTVNQYLSISRPVVTAAISGKSLVCRGDTLSLHASGADTYYWNTGDSGSVLHVRPFVNSTYAVTASSGMCHDTLSFSVAVEQIETNISINYLHDNGAELTVTQSGNCSWFPTEHLSCSQCETTSGSFPQNEVICVQRINDRGCVDTACATVIVNSFYMPNAFSPDGNSMNDLYRPVLKDVHDYHFMVFDRWGEMVYETSDLESGWNGEKKGHPCEQNVYVYRITYKDDRKNDYHEYSGSVTLLR